MLTLYCFIKLGIFIILYIKMCIYSQAKYKDGSPQPDYGSWHKAVKVDR